ncbi:MAG: DUF885 family protein, partial [Longimicrobiales bacterium]
MTASIRFSMLLFLARLAPSLAGVGPEPSRVGQPLERVWQVEAVADSIYFHTGPLAALSAPAFIEEIPRSDGLRWIRMLRDAEADSPAGEVLRESALSQLLSVELQRTCSEVGAADPLLCSMLPAMRAMGAPLSPKDVVEIAAAERFRAAGAAPLKPPASLGLVATVDSIRMVAEEVLGGAFPPLRVGIAESRLSPLGQYRPAGQGQPAELLLSVRLPRFDHRLPIILAHEGHFGHHAEFGFREYTSQRHPLIADIGWLGWSEGWATFGEEIAAHAAPDLIDALVFRGHRQRLASELLAAARLVEGAWSIDEASDTLADRLGLPADASDAVARRIAARPYKTYAYLLGAMAWREAVGGRMSLARDFLNRGPAPVTILCAHLAAKGHSPAPPESRTFCSRVARARALLL